MSKLIPYVAWVEIWWKPSSKPIVLKISADHISEYNALLRF